MTTMLSSKQRKLLESMAHDLEPVVRIGKFGVTPTLLQTVREALAAQELIKVKVLENSALEQEEVAEQLVGETGASLIQILGRIIILYRANPERKHRVEFPGMEPSTVKSPVPAKKPAAKKPVRGKGPFQAGKGKGKPGTRPRKPAAKGRR